MKLGKVFGKAVNGVAFPLSYFFFTIILRWSPAQQVGERITAEVDAYNRTRRDEYCFSCGNRKLNPKTIGTEGVFTWTSTVYVCPKCGYEQDRSGDEYRDGFDRLEKQRIIRVGERYRYYFCGLGVVLLLIIAGAIFLVWIFPKMP